MEHANPGQGATDAELDEALARALRTLIAEAVAAEAEATAAA